MLFQLFLQSKVLEAIQGENYMEDNITEDETLDKLADMQQEIGEAFNYAQGMDKTHGLNWALTLSAL